MEKNSQENVNSPDDENRLIAERRAKLSALREKGNAYPNGIEVDALAAELQRHYAEWDKDRLAAQPVKVKLAGRIMAKRVMGKASFVQLRDRSSTIQLYVQRDALPEGVYQQFKGWDIGDIVAAEGELFRTRTGELSVRLDLLQLLTKSLRPLPEKYHGLSDQETRYRQRYLDLIMSPDSRDVFIVRSRVIRFIRDFFEAPERGFMEVETPMMQIVPGGATARPFITHHNALDIDLYLRVAPELFLKRLVVGGFERVYEINRNFRNEGVSTRHNPEFTMLEFYQAYATYHDLIDLTEELLRGLADAIHNTTEIEYQGRVLDFGNRYTRMTVREAILHFNPEISDRDVDDCNAMIGHAQRLGVPLQESYGLGKIQIEIFEKTAEEQLINPTFITEYPTEVSPLARRKDHNPFVTDRFELFIAGREIANGFSELNDPEDQAERFRAQVREGEQGDQEAMAFDADYIRALEYGMPPTAGEGIGIDRLVMLLTDSASIRDVLLFPYMRPDR